MVVGVVASGLRAIDAHLQATVDAGAFFLMRRGLTKGQIRWGLNTTIAAGALLRVALLWPYYARHPLLTAVVVVSMAVLVIAAEFGSRIDDRAESAGMASRLDNPPAGELGWKVLASLWALGAFGPDSPEVIALVARRLLSAGNVASCVSNLAFLAALYLKKTPRTPPPARKVALEPATA